jgi:hypothetical protein
MVKRSDLKNSIFHHFSSYRVVKSAFQRYSNQAFYSYQFDHNRIVADDGFTS